MKFASTTVFLIATGFSMLSGLAHALPTDSNQPINVSDLNKGIYFITGQQEGKLLFTNKFIVKKFHYEILP